MLSVKDLVKIYKTKGGVQVRALDGVSIDFPETGMIFLLGRSGSGKSTLLNVVGGLDTPTDGEITVKGKSSKEFSGSDFDSYRNTYVGFVFQEYNILEEFTVEQNIALALQLQNKPASREAVSNILKSVDLEGVEKRKPKTLSGGQRQRIAIARALIKNPKIIMADEPTGALDSSTGAQIFETLKKLSKDRLVIVVSHDRNFAEQYGDRIIELADGKIINDVTQTKEIQKTDTNVTIVNEQTITIKDWSKITDDELKMIFSTMKKSKCETVITSNPNNIDEIKKLSGVEESNTKSSFKKTGKIEKLDYKGEKVEFIKSRLPFKHALRLAFDGIKSKPIRLAFTIILAVIAFVFFGVSSSLMMYDPNYSVANALYGSNYDSIVINKMYGAYFEQTILNYENNDYEKIETNVKLRSAFTKSELDGFNNNTQNLNFAGVIDLGAYETEQGTVFDYRAFRPAFNNIAINFKSEYYYPSLSALGFSDCGEEYLLNNGFTCVAGAYPTKPNEIAIPMYVFNLYANAHPDSLVGEPFMYKQPNEIIGKTIKISNIDFVVTGVYNVGEIPNKYDELLNEDSQLDNYSKTQLSLELEDIVQNTVHTLLFVSNDFYPTYRNISVKINAVTSKGLFFGFEPIDRVITDENAESAFYNQKSIWKYDYVLETFDLNGNPFKYVAPSENEVYIPIRRVLHWPTTNGSDFYDTIKINEELYREKYPRFIELYELYSKHNNNLSKHDMMEFARLLLNVYKDVMGEELDLPKTVYAKNSKGNQVTLTVKGYYAFGTCFNDNGYENIVSDAFCDKYATIDNEKDINNVKYTTNYNHDPYNEKYGAIITPTQNTIEQTYFMLEFGNDVVSYDMTNLIYQTTSQMADLIFGLKILFWLAGGLFGLFASLMLFNFITVSISSKNKEIGILRAVGARKNDVFKIFITEALIITLICFVISAVLSGFTCSFINTFTLENALGIKLLDYTAINVLLLLGISFIISMLATFIPVTKIANKSPVDSIRAL